ncbi:hypothetical protein SprV_0702280600 [Sparganum proliferum]
MEFRPTILVLFLFILGALACKANKKSLPTAHLKNDPSGKIGPQSDSPYLPPSPQRSPEDSNPNFLRFG